MNLKAKHSEKKRLLKKNGLREQCDSIKSLPFMSPESMKDKKKGVMHKKEGVGRRGGEEGEGGGTGGEGGGGGVRGGERREVKGEGREKREEGEGKEEEEIKAENVPNLVKTQIYIFKKLSESRGRYRDSA